MKIRGNTVGTTIKPEAIKDKLGIPEGEGGGEGLSDTSKSLLIAILRNAVYTSNQSANITALETELNKTTPHTHSYTSSVTTQATCTTDGVRTYICSCGHSYTEAIPATGHKYVDGVCSVCGASDPNHGGTEGGETHTHSYSSSVTKEATCTTEGVRTYTCSCGHTYTESISATGHNFVDGTCTVCGEADPNYVVLTGITATYSGGDVLVGTALTDISGIVVTATYSDGSTATVTDYTLTGTIAEGSSTITVVYEGKTATFTVNGVRDVWSYDISKLNVTKCSTGWDVANEICLNMSTIQQSRRRSYLLTSGAKCCKKTTNGTTWEDSEYYPIPIPDTATRVDIRIEPSTQYVALAVLEYDPNTDTYTRMQDPGWSLGNTYAVFTAKENQYLTVVSKYDSSGTQYPVEPTAITVTFSVASVEDTYEPNGVWLTGCSGSARASSDPTAVIYNNNTARATYVSASGSVGIQYFNGSTFSDCPYYPVLIPAGKRNVTVSCEGYTWGIAYLQVQNGKWVRIADPGWQTLNGSTHTITDINAEAVFINLKVGTAGTESITNVPDTVTVTFS